MIAMKLVTLSGLLIQSHVLSLIGVWLCCTLYVFFFRSIAKPSTALWTRAPLLRPACPPTTTQCWASTTPGTTSRCERPVTSHALFLAVRSRCLICCMHAHIQRGLRTRMFCKQQCPVASVQTRVQRNLDGIRAMRH